MDATGGESMKHPTTHPLYLLDAKNELFQVYDVHSGRRNFLSSITLLATK
jgi:hypothetical protein